MKPKLSSKTPDNSDVNSLIINHEKLIAHFNSSDGVNRVLAIVELGVTQVVTQEGGEQQATFALRHIEEITGTLSEHSGEQMLLDLYKMRTNNKALPSPAHDTPLDLSGLPREAAE
jgi:hypothetical protein